RSQYYITRALFGTRSLFAMTEPQFSLAKDDDTPFKVNGDPSPLTDQRIPTQRCECSLTDSQEAYGLRNVRVGIDPFWRPDMTAPLGSVALRFMPSLQQELKNQIAFHA